MWWDAASPKLNDTPVVCIYMSYNRSHIEKCIFIYIYINTELLDGNKGHQEEAHHPTHRFRRLFLHLLSMGWRGCASATGAIKLPPSCSVYELVFYPGRFQGNDDVILTVVLRNRYIFSAFFIFTHRMLCIQNMYFTSAFGACSSTFCQWDGEDVPAPWSDQTLALLFSVRISVLSWEVSRKWWCHFDSSFMKYIYIFCILYLHIGYHVFKMCILLLLICSYMNEYNCISWS